MDYFLVLAPLLYVPILAWLSRLSAGTLKGAALHPFNIVGILTAIITFDFLTLLRDTDNREFSQVLGYFITSPWAVGQGAQYFFLCSTIVVAAIGAAILVKGGGRARAAIDRRRPSDAALQYADYVSAKVVMAICASMTVGAALTLVAISLQQGSIFYVAGVRTSFFRDYLGLVILCSVGLPAFFIYGSRHGLSKGTIFYALLLGMSFIPVGTRSWLVFLAVGLAFWVAQKYKVSLIFTYMALPAVAIFAAVFRYFAREFSLFASYQQFVNYYGGYFALMFRTPEVSFAEAITVGVTHDTIVRSPLDTILVSLAAPLPREQFPWKPLGASSDFTRDATPEAFMLSGSESTVTGFINLLIEYGYWLSLVVLFVLVWWWARLWVKYARQAWSAGLVGPNLILIAYLFYRADIYNVSMYLWPLGGVFLMHRVIRRFIAGSANIASQPRWKGAR